MLSGVVRRQLSYALDRHLTTADGPSVLFTTLSGERHEMGGLMGAVVAASRGFHCIYLGPDLPAEEIGRFCRHQRVHALALSLVTQPDVIDAAGQLLELRRHVSAEIEIWVAGQAAMLLARHPLPDGVEAKAERMTTKGSIQQYQTTLTLTSIDKQKLGQVAAEMHKLRKPDAYKGKGIRYAGVPIKLKPGKTGK